MTFTNRQIKRWLIPPEYEQLIALRKRQKQFHVALQDGPNSTIGSNIRLIQMRLDYLEKKASGRHKDWYKHSAWVEQGET